MKIRNLIYAVCNQLLRPKSWRNIFITYDAFGIFSRYSHISRSTGRPKMMYLSKSDAKKAADVMSKNMVFTSLYINVSGVTDGISGKQQK